MQNLNHQKNTCSNNCASRIITDYERGEAVCESCGEIVTEYVQDPVHGEGMFTQDSSNTRTGRATSLVIHDRGLSTVIGNDRDSTGNMLSAKSKFKFNRLRIWDQRSKSTTSMSRAFIIMNSVMSKLTIPRSVVERAAYIYRKALDAGLTRGRTISSLAAVSLYVACRETGTPRTMDDLATAANIEKRVLYRDMRRVLTRLDLNPTQYKTSSFVVKVANNTNVSEKVKREALDLLRRGEEMLVTAGKNPMAIASAVVYIACVNNGLQISQRAISQQAGVSDVTVRNSVAVLRDALYKK